MSHLVRRIFENAVSGWVRLFMQMAVFALLTPFIIAMLGKDQFGLWAFALSVVSFCELFDFGLSTTSVKYVAHTQAEKNFTKQNRMLSTLFFCFIGLALLGAITLSLYKIIFPETNQTVFLLICILGCRLFVISLPFSLFRGILVGDQRIVAANTIALFGILLYALLVVICLKLGYGVVALGVCNLISAGVEHVLYMIFSYRYLPNLSISFKNADFGRTLKEMFSFSSSQFLANIGSLVLNNVDVLVVKFFFSYSTVAIYAIALRLTTYGYMLVKQFTNVLTPVIVSLDIGKEHDKLAKLFIEGSRVAIFFSTPILVFAVMIGKPFLVLWLGADFAAAAYPLILLTSALWLRTFYLITGDMLQMTGFHVAFVKFFAITIVVHLSFACIMPLFFSLQGVAIGSLASAIAGFCLFFPRACKEFAIDWKSYSISLIKTFFSATCAMVLFLYGIQELWPIHSFLSLLGVCAAAAMIYLVVLWMTGLSIKEKKSILFITLRLGEG